MLYSFSPLSSSPHSSGPHFYRLWSSLVPDSSIHNLCVHSLPVPIPDFAVFWTLFFWSPILPVPSLRFHIFPVLIRHVYIFSLSIFRSLFFRSTFASVHIFRLPIYSGPHVPGIIISHTFLKRSFAIKNVSGIHLPIPILSVINFLIHIFFFSLQPIYDYGDDPTNTNDFGKRSASVVSESSMENRLNNRGTSKRQLIHRRSRLEGLKELELDGFTSLAEASTCCARVFWLVFLLLVLAILAFEIYKTVDGYVNQPVLTTYTITKNESMRFPTLMV